MKTATISKGGQVSIPADVRRRWGADRVVVEDMGDWIVLRPIPADPIGAAIGSVTLDAPSEDIRGGQRAEESARSERRWARR